MSIKDLISLVSSKETVPIDIQDEVIPLVQAISGFGHLDIYFWKKDMNSNLLRGKIAHWEYPDGNGGTRQVIDIDFPASLSLDWQRMICCKELVHILDPIDCRVMTEESFDKLCEKLVLPPDLQEPTNGLAIWTDRMAVFQALAILFPWASRQHLVEPYRAKKITAEKISELFDIPLRYVYLVMSDDWQKVHAMVSD
jgi:hypothetical protein